MNKSHSPVLLPSVNAVVVEDDDHLRATMCAMLAAEGMEALGCADVEGLAEILDRHMPRIIFLDVDLRHGDAIDAFSLLAARDYQGMVQLISGRNSAAVTYTRLAGEARGLRMRPVILGTPRLPEPVADRVAAMPARRAAPLRLVDRPAGPRHGRLRLVPRSWIIPASGEPGLVDMVCAAGSAQGRDQVRQLIAGWRSGAVEAPLLPGAATRLLVRATIDDDDALGPHAHGASGGPGVTICFEEADILANPARARTIIPALRTHGARVRLEGCGVGSLGRADLLPCPVDEVVLDPRLHARLSADSWRRLAMVVKVAHAGGAMVLADTAARPKDMAWLGDLGVDLCHVGSDMGQAARRPGRASPSGWRRIRLAELQNKLSGAAFR